MRRGLDSWRMTSIAHDAYHARLAGMTIPP
jgi:hypothetical protein